MTTRNGVTTREISLSSCGVCDVPLTTQMSSDCNRCKGRLISYRDGDNLTLLAFTGIDDKNRKVTISDDPCHMLSAHFHRAAPFGRRCPSTCAAAQIEYAGNEGRRERAEGEERCAVPLWYVVVAAQAD